MSKFKINYGEILCTSHTVSQSHIVSESLDDQKKITTDSMIEELKKKRKTCKTCDHFVHDTCNIPSSELHEIIHKHDLKRFKCEICGQSINNLYNAVYKHKIEKKHKVTIPLLCCECFESFCQENVQQAFQARFRTMLIIFGFVFISVISFVILSLLLELHIFSVIGNAALLVLYLVVIFKRSRRLKKALKKSDILRSLM